MLHWTNNLEKKTLGNTVERLAFCGSWGSSHNESPSAKGSCNVLYVSSDV